MNQPWYKDLPAKVLLLVVVVGLGLFVYTGIAILVRTLFGLF
ncbi:hypothetical protein [Serinibacter arcticus]|nr:hypothetical protein [Serinibacter arcticus]